MMATEIIKIDASWAEKWTKTGVPFLSAPTVFVMSPFQFIFPGKMDSKHHILNMNKANGLNRTWEQVLRFVSNETDEVAVKNEIAKYMESKNITTLR